MKKNLDYLCNCKSEISNLCNVVEGQCLQAMKIVHYFVSGCFDWLISGQQSDNPLREAISILSGKYKRFTFVHPVIIGLIFFGMPREIPFMCHPLIQQLLYLFPRTHRILISGNDRKINEKEKFTFDPISKIRA